MVNCIVNEQYNSNPDLDSMITVRVILGYLNDKCERWSNNFKQWDIQHVSHKMKNSTSKSNKLSGHAFENLVRQTCIWTHQWFGQQLSDVRRLLFQVQFSLQVTDITLCIFIKSILVDHSFYNLSRSHNTSNVITLFKKMVQIKIGKLIYKNKNTQTPYTGSERLHVQYIHVIVQCNNQIFPCVQAWN